jgi:hypothetical protein
LFSRLQAQRYPFRAYFGAAAAAPFEVITNTHNEIILNASVLIKSVGFPKTEMLKSQQDKMLDAIGWGTKQRPDNIDHALDNAVKAIETFCQPILEGRSHQSWWRRPR